MPMKLRKLEPRDAAAGWDVRLDYLGLMLAAAAQL